MLVIKCQNGDNDMNESVDYTTFELSSTLQVVQEYERAVIFRLGRLLSGGARGPGVRVKPQ